MSKYNDSSSGSFERQNNRNNKVDSTPFESPSFTNLSKGSYILSLAGSKVKKSFRTLEERDAMSEAVAKRRFKNTAELIDFMKGPKVAEGNVDTDVNI
jgi:hypothetical protein